MDAQISISPKQNFLWNCFCLFIRGPNIFTVEQKMMPKILWHCLIMITLFLVKYKHSLWNELLCVYFWRSIFFFLLYIFLIAFFPVSPSWNFFLPLVLWPADNFPGLGLPKRLCPYIVDQTGSFLGNIEFVLNWGTRTRNGVRMVVKWPHRIHQFFQLDAVKTFGQWSLCL